MKENNIALIGAAIIPLLAGCALTPVTLDSVGPVPVKAAAYVPTGWLRVYTATDAHEIGDNTYYYTHTGYRIYNNENGQLWKYIPNHTGDMDEAVANVQIPEGNYRISAQSEAYNLVSVPVKIEAGKTTDVHLETTWKVPSGASTNDVVYLPDGYPVGWKSSLTK